MENSFLTFGKEQFNKLFPFYVLVSRDHKIVSFGSSIHKLFPINEGDDFYEIFSIKRFTTGVGEIDSLYQLVGQVVILNCNWPQAHTFLRGEFTTIEGDANDLLLFMGTPWFGSMEDLISKNLTISDFALHDPMIDLLHVLKTQEITTNEIRQLLDKVNGQRKVLKADKELILESEKRLSLLIQNLQVGILLEDDQRRIVVTNAMFAKIFGISTPADELVGQDCVSAANVFKSLFADQEGFLSGIDNLLKNKQVVLSEQLEMVDGRVIERDYIPIFVDDQYKGNVWKYNDITERKKHERTLRTQEEKYRRIIENMNLGLIEVNEKDEIQYANQSFCEISGYTLNELLNREAAKLFASEENQAIMRQKSHLREKGIADIYEMPVKNKNGEVRWWLISGAPNYNHAGKYIGSIGIHLDITDQKKLEEQLRDAKVKAEESSRAKENFLANMSHEIRTPLNAIIGMVRELSHTTLDTTQHSYVNHSMSASQHLLSIVNNILDISKIEAGQLELDVRPFSIFEVLKDAEAILAPTAKEKMLRFELSYSPSTNQLHLGDPNRLRQIFINIISNAIKFTESGSVTLACQVTRSTDAEDFFMITVDDTGIGMEQPFLKNLFGKFTQESKIITSRFGGTGLGMAITHELLQLMDGTIEVRSEKGVGSKFSVQLSFPRVTTQYNHPAKSTTTANSKSIKVLLVEDSPVNRLVARNSLKRHGIIVVEAKNGKEAVELFQSESFDVILMDMQMPVMSGLEATRIIREELKSAIPIIALTANVFRSEIDSCINAGMNDYIVKPFEEKLLINVIHKHVFELRTGGSQRNNLLIQKATADFDLTELKLLADGDPDFLREVLQLFKVDVVASVAEIRELIDAGDYNAVKSVIHRIKPSFEAFGIFALKEELHVLSNASSEVSPERIDQALNKIRFFVEHVIAKISAEVNQF